MSTPYTIGTAHFVSIAAALRYYRTYGRVDHDFIAHKVRDGEIHIGRPTLKAGELLSIIDDGTRYAITVRAAV